MLTAAEEIHQGQLIRAWQDHEGGPDAAPARIIRSCPMGELLPDKSQTNPLEVLPFEEIIAKVREQLPDEFALIQLHLECMNKEDISHLLGISRQQTRTELNNARMKLQKEFTLKGARELLAA